MVSIFFKACRNGDLETIDKMSKELPDSLSWGLFLAYLHRQQNAANKIAKICRNSNLNDALGISCHFDEMHIAKKIIEFGATFEDTIDVLPSGYSFSYRHENKKFKRKYEEWEFLQESIKKVCSEFINDDLAGIITDY